MTIRLKLDDRIDANRNSFIFDLAKHTCLVLDKLGFPKSDDMLVEVVAHFDAQDQDILGKFDKEEKKITIFETFNGYLNPLIFVHEYVHAELQSRGVDEVLDKTFVSSGLTVSQWGILPKGSTLNEIFTDAISVIIFETATNMKVSRELNQGYIRMFHFSLLDAIINDAITMVRDSFKNDAGEVQFSIKSITRDKKDKIKLKFACQICYSETQWKFGQSRFGCRKCHVFTKVAPIVPAESYHSKNYVERPCIFSVSVGSMLARTFLGTEVNVYVEKPSRLATAEGRIELSNFRRDPKVREKFYNEEKKMYMI